jgi:hypothetical protein
VLDLKIERLRLNVHDVGGQSHRLKSIAERAVALVADRLSGDGNAPAKHRDDSGNEVRIDLGRMTNEQVAERLADSLMAAVRSRTRLRPNFAPGKEGAR